SYDYAAVVKRTDWDRFHFQLAQTGAGLQRRRHRDAGREPPGSPAGAPGCQQEDRCSPPGDAGGEERMAMAMRQKALGTLGMT
ncbi:hypothetical protein E2320_006155, partial [Naja naja]